MRALVARVRSESGVAMIVAMGTLMITLLLTAVVVDAATQLSAASNNDTNAKRALEAAEAGLQETTYRLNMLSPSAVASQVKCIGGVLESVNTIPPTLDNGTLCDPYTEQIGNGAQYTTYVSTPFSTTGSCAGVQVGVSTNVVERCVTSTGTVNGVSRRVQARVAAGLAAPIFPLAGMVGFKSLSIGNVAVINGGEGSNGQITLANNSSATSTIIGPGGSVSAPAASPCTNSNTTPPLYGCVVQQPNPFVPAVISYPNMVPPAPLPDGNSRLAAPGCATTGCDTLVGGATWNATTRSLVVPGGASVILGGGTYDFCTLTMGNNSTVSIASLAKTAIYIDSYNRLGSDGSHSCPLGSAGFSMSNNSAFINNSPPAPGGAGFHDSRALQIYVYDQANVTLSNNTAFYGTIYAPLSNVTVSNNGNTYGAVVGNTVTLNPSQNTAFYADANDTTIGTQSIYLFFRTAWHQCTISRSNPNDPQSGC
jgi:Tfp pilus assembly protein PilX